MKAIREVVERERRALRIAFVLFDEYELLDAFGPLELFATCAPLRARSLSVLTLSAAPDRRARPAGGPVTLTDACIHDAAAISPPPDVLFVPGGLGTRALVDDARFVRRLGELARAAKLTLTVCTGSFLLAATGALDGLRATTNKRALPSVAARFPAVRWAETARWVHDGAVLSSSGVSAGTDMAAHFLGAAFGAALAARVLRECEYTARFGAEDDPFADAARARAAGAHPPALRSSRDGRPPLRVLLLLYDQIELLDTVGPLEVFELANRALREAGAERGAFELTTVSVDGPAVRSFGGPRFEPDVVACAGRGGGEAEEAAARLIAAGVDVVLVPGGVGSLREACRADTLSLLRALARACRHSVLSVCTGSQLLAAAGLLDGRRATTNKMLFDLVGAYGPRVRWVRAARWVVDGAFVTASGVSAGTDMALAVVERSHGRALALAAAEAAEYAWAEDPVDDPFVGCIPRPTLLRRLFVRGAPLVVGAMFRVGFALGFSMRGVSAMLRTAA